MCFNVFSCRMNMERHYSRLVVESSYSDLVINVGRVTLGESNRKRLQKVQREKEKMKVSQAACALLNSGGGVIQLEMANNDENLVEMGLDLEEALRTLILFSNLQAFFETKQQGSCYYIFVKSWSSDTFLENTSVKPRICSLSSSLYCRSGTSVFLMDSGKAFHFLKTKKTNAKRTSGKEPFGEIFKVIHPDVRDVDPTYCVFQKDHFEHGEVMPFPESQFIEFKQFATKHIEQYTKDTILEYIPAFANTEGGYLVIGVDDKSRKVLGCAKENVDRDSLKKKIEEAIQKLSCVHFCQSQCQIDFTVKILDVLAKGELYGYACVIGVKRFCGAVFSGVPSSWMVKGNDVCSLTTEEWLSMMMDTDPGKMEKTLFLSFLPLQKLQLKIFAMTLTSHIHQTLCFFNLQVSYFPNRRKFGWVMRSLSPVSYNGQFPTSDEKKIWGGGGDCLAVVYWN